MPGHRPDVQDGGAGVSMGAGTAMEARVWLKAPVLAAWIYIDIYGGVNKSTKRRVARPQELLCF